jgi:hypothetical protein
MRLEELVRTVKSAVFDHGTKALVIDFTDRHGECPCRSPESARAAS